MSAFSATLPTFKARLSLLYVINDVLFHATNAYGDTKTIVPSATIQYLPALLKSVQSAPNPRPETINKLFKLWSEKRYFSDEEFARILNKPQESVTVEKEAERKPLVKPTTLGTNGDPHWLLPVSCVLEVMVQSTMINLI